MLMMKKLLLLLNVRITKVVFSTNEKRLATERVILTEVNKNNYVVSAIKPNIVSALGAVPKTDSNDIRLIHNASRPLNRSLNYMLQVKRHIIPQLFR